MKVTLEAMTGFPFKVAFSQRVKVMTKVPRVMPQTIKIHEKEKEAALAPQM